jgi:hypothetical protein
MFQFWKEIDLDVSKDLHVLRTHEYENLVSEMPSAFMHARHYLWESLYGLNGSADFIH